MEKVRGRLLRSTAALNAAKILYAVAGGNAVAAWVSRVDEVAVRNTRDVDILIRREDLPAVIQVMESAGFVHRDVAGIEMFLDGAGGREREAVHLVFAGEVLRKDHLLSAPDVSEFEWSNKIRILTLDALVRMKLTSFRRQDQMHLRDMLDIGLLDETWPSRFVPELGKRLQFLLDHPED